MDRHQGHHEPQRAGADGGLGAGAGRELTRLGVRTGIASLVFTGLCPERRAVQPAGADRAV
ncbi:hypothethical protein (plasmid) [Ralstonia solanacearum CMR15]|nr:hypothethical protein [Ralstonia solanacearum CMR15]